MCFLASQSVLIGSSDLKHHISHESYPTQEVRAKFNGRNTRALAREYGVSVRWVQRLLIERFVR